MSKENEISTDVKTVLHGEVLDPEDEIPKKSKEEEEIETLKAKLAQAEREREAYIAAEVHRRNQYPAQYYYHQQMMNVYSKPNIFGCMNHYPFFNWPCQRCGKY